MRKQPQSIDEARSDVIEAAKKWGEADVDDEVVTAATELALSWALIQLRELERIHAPAPTPNPKGTR